MKITNLLTLVVLTSSLLIVADQTNPDLYKENGDFVALKFQLAGSTTNLTVISTEGAYNENGNNINVTVQATDPSIDSYATNSDTGKYYKVYENGPDIVGFIQVPKKNIQARKINNVLKSGTTQDTFTNAYSWAYGGETLSGFYENNSDSGTDAADSWVYDIYKPTTSGFWCTLDEGTANFNVMRPLRGEEITQTEYSEGPTININRPSDFDSYDLIQADSSIKYYRSQNKAQDSSAGRYFIGVGNEMFMPESNSVYLGSYTDGNNAVQYVAGTEVTENEYNAV